MTEKEAEKSKSYQRFPWSDQSTNVLIDAYGEKIEDFLNPNKTQATLWKYVVKRIKEELADCIDKEILNLLAPNRVSSKFVSLKKAFKSRFYDTNLSEEEKEISFAYYKKMNQLFTDYATKHLNNTLNESNLDNSMNNNTTVTDADISNFIVKILSDDDKDKTSVTILESKDQESFSSGAENSPDVSLNPAEKIRLDLAEMPSEQLCIQKETFKIDPNTPFNRKVNNSTILHQKSSFQNSNLSNALKRKLLNDLEPKPVIKKKSPINYIQKKKLDDSDQYFVEALDECNNAIEEISHIPVRRSKAIYNDSSSVGLVALSPSVQTLNLPSNYQKVQNNTLPTKKRSDIIIQSVMEIPMFPLSEDETSIDIPRSNNNEDKLKKTPNANIKPMILNVPGINRKEITITKITPDLSKSNQESPPAWFGNFLKIYNHNVKVINDKLDKIIAGNMQY